MGINWIVGTVVLVLGSVAVQAQPVRASMDGALVMTSPAQAVGEAMRRSPLLRGARAVRDAVQGDRLQAGLWPNPEISVLRENFGRMGNANNVGGFDPTQTTLGVTQRIELGGKRGARINFANQGNMVAELDEKSTRLDLGRNVLAALAEAVAATRSIELEQERFRLSDQTLRAARGRVEAGKEPLVQQRRAEVGRSTADLATERARQQAAVALQNLAVLLGVSRVELAPRQAWFDDIGSEPRPVARDPMSGIKANPDIAKLDAIVAQRRANIRLQHANAVPDVNVQGGIRRLEGTNGTDFVAGVSIPLPIFNRNQGAIARANAEYAQAEAEAQQVRLQLVAALDAAERRLATAWRAARILKREVVPEAQQAASFAGSGYQSGKFGLLEVLDAQRALSEAKAQLNDALREVHVRRAEVNRLLGSELGSPAPG